MCFKKDSMYSDKLLVTTEMHCDQVLKSFLKFGTDKPLEIDGIKNSVLLIQFKSKEREKDLLDILNYLVIEGLLKELERNRTYSLTVKGRMFCETDSFVDRKRRWDLERRIKEQQKDLNILDLKIKSHAGLISIISILLSVIAILISIFRK